MKRIGKSYRSEGVEPGATPSPQPVTPSSDLPAFDTFEPLEVVWLDHAFHQGQYIEQPMDGLVVWNSVGYLVKWTQDVLVLAQSLYMGTEPHETLHIQAAHLLQVTPLKRRKSKTWAPDHGEGEEEPMDGDS